LWGGPLAGKPTPWPASEVNEEAGRQSGQPRTGRPPYVARSAFLGGPCRIWLKPAPAVLSTVAGGDRRFVRSPFRPYPLSDRISDGVHPLLPCN